MTFSPYDSYDDLTPISSDEVIRVALDGMLDEIAISEDGSKYYPELTFHLGNDAYVGFIPKEKDGIRSLETFVKVETDDYEYFIDDLMIQGIKDLLEEDEYKELTSTFQENGGHWISASLELGDQTIKHRISLGHEQIGRRRINDTDESKRFIAAFIDRFDNIPINNDANQRIEEFIEFAVRISKGISTYLESID